LPTRWHSCASWMMMLKRYDMKKSEPEKICALCPAILTAENFTREHIIPNSIGGRKKTTGFICNTCNNDCGKKWESVLAEQFLWFSLATGVKRENGNSPNLSVKTVEGENLLLRHDGSMTAAKPTYSEQEENGKIKIKIQSRTKEEARKIVKGVVKKYPTVDFNESMDNFIVEQSYLESPLAMELQFGGPDGGRSMVKTAFALASEYGISNRKCEKAIDYLKDSEVTPPFGFCYTVDLVKNRPVDEIFHCVAIRGLPKFRKLLGYVEYFNMARILVELSDEYDGDDIYHSYSIDPTTGIEADIEVDFNVDIEILKAILDGDGMPLDKYNEAANYILPIVLKKNFDRERNRVVVDAAKLAFETLGVEPDQNLPQEKNQEFINILMEQIKPFIIANLKNKFH